MINKEWLQQKIADMEAARDEIPFGLGEDGTNTLAALRIALASLEAEPRGYIDAGTPDDGISILTENKLLKTDIALYTAPPAPANAEPVAWLWSHRKHPSEVTLVRPEDDERAEGAYWSGWSCQALYAAQPAPVSVPDERPSLNNGIVGFDEGWNACRAAMLQGAENAESPTTTQTAPSLDSSQIIAESPSGNSPLIPACSCGTCRPVTFTDSRFVVCPKCGNKRCPHANDHRHACTGSNEPGQ